MSDKKSRLLYLIHYLQEQTDEQHPKSLAEILDYLNSQGCKAVRKTFYDDLALLIEQDMDIHSIRKERAYYYYLGARDFELHELKLLIDVVQASPFLTSKKSMELIGKLGKLTSKPYAAQLNRQVFVMNRIRTENEHLYYSVDGINTAINSNCKVKFRYFNWTTSGEREYRRNGEYYEINPVALCVDRFYYLVSYDADAQQYRHFRVDRMDSLSVSTSQRDPLPRDFDLGKYTKNIVSMYGGETCTIRLKVQNSLINSMVDRFGSDVPMHPSDDTHFELTTPVEVSPTFFGWLSQFGAGIELTYPESVRSDYVRFLKEAVSLYE